MPQSSVVNKKIVVYADSMLAGWHVKISTHYWDMQCHGAWELCASEPSVIQLKVHFNALPHVLTWQVEFLNLCQTGFEKWAWHNIIRACSHKSTNTYCGTFRYGPGLCTVCMSAEIIISIFCHHRLRNRGHAPGKNGKFMKSVGPHVDTNQE